MGEYTLPVVLLGVSLGLYFFTTIAEHYVDNPRKLRWSMIIASIIFGLLLSPYTDNVVIEGISSGAFIFALIYLVGPITALWRPSMREALKYPENEKSSSGRL